MRAYKVFNYDWTCNGFRFEVGKTYEEDNIKMCFRGFHCCKELIDCFKHYNFIQRNKVAEVEIDESLPFIVGRDKYCCSKITIVRQIHWEEVLTLVNTGKNNTGKRNSGHNNSGNGNSGNSNSGNSNSGDYNSGDRNSGNSNYGDYNSGNWNFGNGNSGNYNYGGYNSGNHCCGIFNTIDNGFNFFNIPIRPTEKNLELVSDLNIVLNFGTKENPIAYKDAWKKYWNKTDSSEKQHILSLPHFNPDVFFKITGIKVNEKLQQNNTTNFVELLKDIVFWFIIFYISIFNILLVSCFLFFLLFGPCYILLYIMFS